VGLYYATGTTDMYPHKYQDFSSPGSTNLSNLDDALNGEGYTSFTTASRTKFLEYGYYSLDSVISTILADTSNPNWAL